jgi:K+-transporting ATPase ATPase B chain
MPKASTIYLRALVQSFVKLNPVYMIHNFVMFTVEVGSVITTIAWVYAAIVPGLESPAFIGLISLWLWFCVIFANFSEALAEGRGKARAEAMRSLRAKSLAKRLKKSYDASSGQAPNPNQYEIKPSTELRRGDLFLVETGDIIPIDGEVVVGVAAVDESAITGESAPVIRESGGDRSAITGGTRVISDWLVGRSTIDQGQGFLDRMISLVEGAKRQKTPTEIALNILLAGLSVIFIVVCTTLLVFSTFSTQITSQGHPISITVDIALYVCLAPTTIGGLLSAIGIAGMDRLIRKNVIAVSGKAIEAAGDVDVLLLDKTGTITLGNRQAEELIPVDGTPINVLAEAAQLASMADETPEGRSVVVYIKNLFRFRPRIHKTEESIRYIPFSAHTRMSGVDIGNTRIRKGAADAVYDLVKASGNQVSNELVTVVEQISHTGGTPLVVAKDGQALGVIHLKDTVKGGIRERFQLLRKMGIKTVMITGDNKLTAAAIAAEAGVDDFLAEAKPESKLALIRKYQENGQMVAMTGDGTNDAPALAQADVAVAMNTGTQPAREAANMVDLDSNPTKLCDIVETGKQLLMTRGALTTFSIANDIAKYFVIIPPAFSSTYPVLKSLNFMQLQNPILSAVIFNAIIIILLIPLALRGVKYRPISAQQVLRINLLVYGLGGLIAPFIGIKLIDMLLVGLGVHV